MSAQEKSFTINFTETTLQFVMNVLVKEPYKDVAKLVQEILSQVEEQNTKQVVSKDSIKANYPPGES